MNAKNKLTFKEQLTQAYKKAKKAKNTEAIRYYAEKLDSDNLVACASFEQFKNSWAYTEWKKHENLH